MAAWYCFKGGLNFLKTRKELTVTPVSNEAQDKFAEKFWGTKPVFNFITKRFKSTS